MKQSIIEFIEKSLQDIYGISIPELESLIEVPSNTKLGDFSLPCFSLAKKLKRTRK
jgi:arginyl-tRNA synthetase